MIRYAFLLLGSLAAGILMAVVLHSVASDGPAETPPGALGHPDAYPAPDFRLVDHHGERRTLEDFRGQWVLLFFGFTHCPDVCPVTLGNVTRALDALGDDADAFTGVLVTVDPERDRPERLAEYLEHFHPSMVGLTGRRAEIREVVREYGIYAEKTNPASEVLEGSPHAHPGGHGPGEIGALGDVEGADAGDHGDHPPGAGEGYLVDHTSLLLVVDPEGKVVTSFAPYTPPEELVEGLRHLLDEG